MDRSEAYYFDVHPRYTPGSPGLVSRRVGAQVARDEREVYGRHLSGLYGPQGIAKAQRLGLSRIVWSRHESRGTLYYLDAITDERWQEKIRRSWRQVIL